MDGIETIREQLRRGYIVGQWDALGRRGMSLTARMSILEDIFLSGFQAAQRAAGLVDGSPEFVVDVHIELARRGTEATGDVQGWHIYRKGGTSEYLEFKALLRSDRRNRPSAKAATGKD
jgi:hypothetical protein